MDKPAKAVLLVTTIVLAAIGTVIVVHRDNGTLVAYLVMAMLLVCVLSQVFIDAWRRYNRSRER